MSADAGSLYDYLDDMRCSISDLVEDIADKRAHDMRKNTIDRIFLWLEEGGFIQFDSKLTPDRFYEALKLAGGYDEGNDSPGNPY